MQGFGIKGTHSEYRPGLSPRVVLHTVDTEGLQGRPYPPRVRQEGEQGSVVGVARADDGYGPALYAVLLDTGAYVEVAPWEIAEDDELPAEAGRAAEVGGLLDANKEFAAGLLEPAGGKPSPFSAEGAQDRGETFPDYLRRVGADYAESGNDATAEDYGEAADRINRAVADLARIRSYSRDPNVKSACTGAQDSLLAR